MRPRRLPKPTVTFAAEAAPDVDRIATICAQGSFLAQILADPEDFMDCDAIHGLYSG